LVTTIVHPAATAELAEAVGFYEERAEGLGHDLYDEVARVFAEVAANPHIAPVFDDPYRRYLCRRFPFSVVYRVTSDSVRFLAVMHQRRRPGYWKGRE
jgi:toxin ParE1/3/4